MKIAFVCSGANATPFSEFIPLSDDLRSRGHDTFFLSSEPYPASIEARLKGAGQAYYPAGKNPPDLQVQAPGKGGAERKKRPRSPGPLRRLPPAACDPRCFAPRTGAGMAGGVTCP